MNNANESAMPLDMQQVSSLEKGHHCIGKGLTKRVN